MEDIYGSKPEESRKAVYRTADGPARYAASTGQRVTASARDTTGTAEMAGNEMKATLQQLRMGVRQLPKKADKKYHR
ncbi:MAG TPA: hypothetical protein VLA21_09360 [Candidatus Limnocylindria bacterium]|nr:hypothetical protein [Candidatus Limnocylindria bacterium]